MPLPGSLPRWATDPDNPLIDIVEPSEAEKDEGWNKYQKPPYNTFNWLQKQTYDWLDYLAVVTKFPRGVQLWSAHPFTFTAAGALDTTYNLQIKFHDAGELKTNFIAATDTPFTIPNGSVVVFRPDFSSGATQLIQQAVYANLDVGEYAIVAESSLTDTNNDEIVLFRRTDVSAIDDQYGVGFTILEIPLTGQQYITDSESGVRAYFGGAKILDSIRILDGDNFSMYSDNGSTVKVFIDGATGKAGFGTGTPTSPTGRDQVLDISAAGISSNAQAGLAFHNGSSFTTGGNWELASGSPAPGQTDFFLSADSVAIFRWQANGNVSIGSTRALYFDGVTGIGDTYMLEEAANQLGTFVGGSLAIRIESAIGRVAIGGAFNLAIAQGAAMYFDGGGVGGDTYAQSVTANTLTFFAGGQSSLRLTASTLEAPTADVLIDTTYKLYFDTGVNTYIYAAGAGQINIYTAGTSAAVITSTFFSIDARDFAVQAGRRIYFDGGVNTYAIYDDANDDLLWFVNGTEKFRFLSSSTSSSYRVRSPDGTVECTMFADQSGGNGGVGTILGSSFPFHISSNGTSRLSFETSGRIVVSGSADLIVENDTTPNEDGHVTAGSLAKAWGFYLDGGGSPSDSYNIATIGDDDGDGLYIVTFSNAMANANYATLVTPHVVVGDPEPTDRFGMTTNINTAGVAGAVVKSTTQFSVHIRTDDDGTVDSSFSVTVFGDLA